MIILLDADGPLYDFTGGYLAELEAETGELHHEHEVDRWNIHECPFFAESAARMKMTVRALQERVEERVSKPGFCERLIAKPEARKAVSLLHAVGHEVWAVTSPWRASPTWAYERARRLEKDFDIHPDQIVSVGRKHRVHGDVFVDDRGKNVSGWKAAWPRGIAFLFDQPHNQAFNEGPFIRGGWREILSFINLPGDFERWPKYVKESWGTVCTECGYGNGHHYRDCAKLPLEPHPFFVHDKRCSNPAPPTG